MEEGGAPPSLQRPGAFSATLPAGASPRNAPDGLLFIMANLFQASLKLRNAGAGNSVHVAAVAALQKVVGNACYHCTVVAAELKWREDAVEVGALGQHGAEAGISCDAAAADYCFEAGVVNGSQ